MQDPINEVRGVVKGLVAARNASEQKYCIQNYFAPDASFDHPLCAVASGPNSRDSGVLPIYQWLRCMFSPDIEVHHIGFDEKNNKMFLDVTQRLTPNAYPLNQVFAPLVRLIVVLQFQRGADGKFYIKRQEDFYQPQVLPFGLTPGARFAVSTIKRVVGFNCAVLAGITQLTLGYWKPGKDSISNGNK